MTKRSFVEYRLPRIIRCEHISKCVGVWIFTPKADASDELYAKIAAGVSASEFSPSLVIKYYQANAQR